MILLVEVRSGPSSGKGVRLHPGQTVRIGRTAKSDFVLPADGHLSGAHFEVSLSDSECRIRDLKSTNGTLLNGESIGEAVLHDGDSISAGKTVFRVTIGSGEVPEPAASPALGATATTQQRLLALLRSDYQPLFAILDASSDARVLTLLAQSKDEYQSLYDEPGGDRLAKVAPYLVRPGKDSLLLDSLVLEGWSKGWGVYLTCDREFQELRRHLQRFLEVHFPDGKQIYFRFYDPLVLSGFLSAASADDASHFFGPVRQYVMEDEKPDRLLQFSNTGQGVEKKTILLLPRERGEAVVGTTQERTNPMPQEAIPDPKA